MYVTFSYLVPYSSCIKATPLPTHHFFPSHSISEQIIQLIPNLHQVSSGRCSRAIHPKPNNNTAHNSFSDQQLLSSETIKAISHGQSGARLFEDPLSQHGLRKVPNPFFFFFFFSSCFTSICNQLSYDRP